MCALHNKRINALPSVAGTLTWRAFGYDARHVSARYAKCYKPKGI